MSKFVERRWRIASGVGFAVVLIFDLIGKHVAAERVQEIAKRTAGLPIEPGGWLAANVSFDFIFALELLIAAVAAVCWAISAWRSEPGSSFPVVLLVALCFLSFFIMV